MSDATQSSRSEPELRRWLDQASRTAGFDVVGVTEVRAPDHPAATLDSARFSAWIDAGHAGEMEYLKRRNQQGTLVRGNPRLAMPWARSAIICAVNYNFAAPSKRNETQAAPPLSIDPAPPALGWIARYAWTGRTLEEGASTPTDYHEELLARLRELESASSSAPTAPPAATWTPARWWNVPWLPRRASAGSARNMPAQSAARFMAAAGCHCDLAASGGGERSCGGRALRRRFP